MSLFSRNVARFGASTRIYANSVSLFRPIGTCSRRFLVPKTRNSRITKRWATSTTPHSTTVDPAEVEAMRCLDQGTSKLEEGDVEGAKQLYKRSSEIKRNASSLFNLGVTHYHLKEFDEAIAAWKESIAILPSSPDAHTNLASAYMISPTPRPDLALHHLHLATSLSPDDPEIAFNLAAVLEATGRLEEALENYQRSQENGIEGTKISMHIRNVSAKILGKKLKEAEEAEKTEI
ncbi:TPR-like protein [Mycena floridula]|nr:TPR-like protein [Mycena floridula]